MIKTLLHMKPLPGCSTELVELFRRDRIIEKALTVQGCRSVELLETADTVVVEATWDDEGAYGRWLAHPGRNTSQLEINQLLSEPIEDSTVGGCFTVALSGTAEGVA